MLLNLNKQTWMDSNSMDLENFVTTAAQEERKVGGANAQASEAL